MNLKTAVGWSVVFHLFLLVMQPPQGFVPVDEERPIKVTYVPTLQAVPSPARPKVQPPPAPVPPKPAPVSAEKPSAPAVSAPPVPKAPRQETSPRPVPQPVVSPPALPVENRPVTVRDADSRSSSSISNLPEGEFAALQHKQRVRQHLKGHLAFPPDGIQGSVRLRLILAPNGTLQDLVLLEASDSRLGEMALEGAQSAEPYPPFPAQMKKSQVLYENIIQYRFE